MIGLEGLTEYVSIPRDTYDDLMDIYAKYNCLYSRMELIVDLIREQERIRAGVLLKAINSPYADRVYKELHETKGADEVEQD